jgi:hypothetical protein
MKIVLIFSIVLTSQGDLVDENDITPLIQSAVVGSERPPKNHRADGVTRDRDHV